MEEAIRKAEVLIEALPYIKEFHRKILVIKYGGSILGEEKIRRGVLEDIVFLSYMGLCPVLVHGGGPNISERMKSAGLKTEFVNGMRVTDEKTLAIVQEELDKLNQMIVNEIQELGGKAAGFSGKDKNIIFARKKLEGGIDLGLVGEVDAIEAKPILTQTREYTICVICPMGMGRDGKMYNINADDAASAIASGLHAEKLVVLTNVKGIMRSVNDPGSFLSTLTIDEARGLIEEKVVQEGMIPKVKACISALEGGVNKTHMIDARIPHGLLLEVFTNEGVGTEIVK
ncbi:MAG: acetylglutamate kinase [Omnitrophica WOR_2 bacterium GWF2_43_52]|nr:MAG: acetylglutamate kinase [Omnitrophica WOR_2 bacterium GWA2_44_7]OGX21408.1 MAG: acetylglutamate kinase [Omnitrophica WOR_2 bacterium GWF2_43_52]OGX57471.1 MAG: acetylglutamate kinase [Omnitrophica WOR_2 bacterium RIFOXYC2_FULL_43_9]HAH21963.1 acetylglutamate kinase [Candidatus Omnitrophota bacterium]HBG62640.1 acetylglutamate kinase [Candidatus Omnitrophota bacterium]